MATDDLLHQPADMTNDPNPEDAASGAEAQPPAGAEPPAAPVMKTPTPPAEPSGDAHAPQRAPRHWPSLIGGAVALVILTIAAFFPVKDAAFIWDDEAIYANPVIQSPNGLRQIWLQPELNKEEPHYWPLTYTSFWIEWRLWGNNPRGYHLVNLALHAAASLLLWGLLRRLRLPCAWLASVLFAIHPLHVESVAWTIERKDVLMAVFYGLALHACMSWSERGAWWSLPAAILFTAAAILAKSMAVSIPVVALVLIVWSTRRLRVADGLLVIFVALAAAALVGLDLRLYNAHADGPPLNLNMLERVVLASRAAWDYAIRLVLPVGLSTIYPQYTGLTEGVWWIWPASWVLLAGVTLLGAALRWWGGGWPAAVLIFLVTLGPILGLIDYGFLHFSYTADRFAYLAAAVPAAGLCWIFGRLWRLRATAMRAALVLVAVALVGTLGILTWRQTLLYRDPIELLQVGAQHRPDAWAVHLMLGSQLLKESRFEEALAALDRAESLRADHADVQYHRARALASLGRIEEAIDLLKRVTEEAPGYALAHHDLAVVYARERLPQMAIHSYQTAIALEPDNPDFLANYAGLLIDLRREDEAMELLDRALAADPRHAQALNNRATIYMDRGELALAEADLRIAVDAAPDHVNALANLGSVRLRQGDWQDAARWFRAAIDLQPQRGALHYNLGSALETGRQRQEAIAAYERALELDPTLAPARAAVNRLRSELW